MFLEILTFELHVVDVLFKSNISNLGHPEVATCGDSKKVSRTYPAKILFDYHRFSRGSTRMYINRRCNLSLNLFMHSIPYSLLAVFSLSNATKKRKRQHKRPATASADGPSSQRGRHSSTINSTMATYSANQPPSVGIALTAFLPPSNTTVSTENVLPPELLQTLVSTVTAEVTNQLSTQLSGMLPTRATHGVRA